MTEAEKNRRPQVFDTILAVAIFASLVINFPKAESSADQETMLSENNSQVTIPDETKMFLPK